MSSYPHGRTGVLNGHIELVDAARDSAAILVEREMRRLDHRTVLAGEARETVAHTLHRLSALLMIGPIEEWQGDPRVVAELFGLLSSPASSRNGACPS